MSIHVNSNTVFIEQINALRGNVLIAHHGDADGIIGAGLLAAYLQQRDCTISFASSAEFGKKEFHLYREAVRGCTAGIFIEAQGMPDCYRELDPLFLNIDHHPSPRPPLLSRTLNPWLHNVSPLPCAAYIVYDLLHEHLPPATGGLAAQPQPENTSDAPAWHNAGWLAARPQLKNTDGAPPWHTASWLAALGSILDYCPDAARDLIAREQHNLVRLPELRDTFHAVQYTTPLVCDLAALVATLPSPDTLLVAEPFATRRATYRDLLTTARATAEISATCVVARTVAGDFRLASPLANTLQDAHPDRAVIVIEEQPLLDRARFSVRWRHARQHVGTLLAAIARELGAGDGTGHATAGSARVPLARQDAFLSRLRAAIAAST